MCLSVIGKIESIDNLTATVSVRGVRMDCRLDLIGEPAAKGDYVLLHTGFAIQKLDKDEALQTMKDIDTIMEIN